VGLPPPAGRQLDVFDGAEARPVAVMSTRQCRSGATTVAERLCRSRAGASSAALVRLFSLLALSLAATSIYAVMRQGVSIYNPSRLAARARMPLSPP